MQAKLFLFYKTSYFILVYVGGKKFKLIWVPYHGLVKNKSVSLLNFIFITIKKTEV